ncbi:MAG: hypothetical protein ACI9UK_000057 [Candidatus Krumholzibacteriia bacterium]
MLTGFDHSELLAENYAVGSMQPPAAILHELTHLAMSQDELPFLAAEMFELLLKKSGQPAAIKYLGGIQYLISEGTPAGARLLAAFLNVSTPGERLVPVIQPLNSSRRYYALMRASDNPLRPIQADWCQRMAKHKPQIQADFTNLGLSPDGVADGNPRNVDPWPVLRALVDNMLGRASAEKFWETDREPVLLTELVRLEVDAWQERISHMAGNINPFRTQSVARILPILNRSDSVIRDLRQMCNWMAEGDFESAFIRPLPRWCEVMDDKDWGHLNRDLRSRDGLAGLGRLARGLDDNPILLPQLAEGTRRIMALSSALVEDGARETSLNLLTSCLLAQSHYANGQIVFALDDEMTDTVKNILPKPGDVEHPLAGLSLVAGLLVIELNEDLPEWEHGLPFTRPVTEKEGFALKEWQAANKPVAVDDLDALRERALALAEEPEDEINKVEAEEIQDMSASALKHLVLTNLQSVSVLLGFLRNPKMTAIPGLVEEVVNRTRNPQIIETVAKDRTLHTGFANKGVAVACLRSPVNVSVKTLRKFCHVKYVSKVELKRMGNDRTGIRKEIAREIKKYLEALA